MNNLNRLSKALEDEHVVKAFKGGLLRWHESLELDPCDPSEREERIAIAATYWRVSRPLEKAAQRLVAELGVPSPILFEEVSKLAHELLLVPSDMFDRCFSRFCQFLRQLIDEERPVRTLPLPITLGLMPPSPGKTRKLWDSGNGLQVEAHRRDDTVELSGTPIAAATCALNLLAEYWSEGALSHIAPRVTRVASTISQIVGVAAYRGMFGQRVLKDGPGEYDSWQLFETLFVLYFSREDAPFRSRIRDALQLLVQADWLMETGTSSEENSKPCIALLSAAWERLLMPQGKGGITDTLSRYTAVLLEPSARERPITVEVLAELYDVRSGLLHGRSNEVDPSTTTKLREVVGGVLLAMMEWCSNRSKHGYDLSKSNAAQELFRELKSASISGAEIVNVPKWCRWYLPSDRATRL